MHRQLNRFIFGLFVLALAGLWVGVAQALPIEHPALAIDWKYIHAALGGWQIRYADGLLNPPWIALLLLPLGALTLKTSWALVALSTLAGIILVIPPTRQRRLHLVTILLGVTAYPTLRLIADGNLDGLVILGIAACLWGLPRQSVLWAAGGLLLAGAKIQVNFLWLVWVGYWLLRSWERRRWARLSAVLAAVIVPCLLVWGAEWLARLQVGPTIVPGMDISLKGHLERAGLPSGYLVAVSGILGATVWAAWRSPRPFDHLTTGLFVCASLLCAPYVSGNSLIVALAVGVLPLVVAQPRLGISLVLLINAQILFPPAIQYAYGAYFSSAVLLLLWGLLLWQVPQKRQRGLSVG